MRRWVAGHRKALAIAGLGILELAAYILADPRNVPPWVVALAAAVNTFGVYAAPRNAQPVSRQDVARKIDYHQPTRHVRREERGP